MPTLPPQRATLAQSAISPPDAEPAQSADETLAEAVRSNLGSTGYHQLQRIDINVENGHVKLSGRVARYYLRQLAQQAAMSTDGVASVGSEIEVSR